MANRDDDDDDRLTVRRGSEHVRIEGTTEELGEIVPPPVEIGDDELRVFDRDESRKRPS